MALTPNINLTTTATTDYPTTTVDAFIQALSGVTNSNMTKIDAFAGETDSVIELLKGVGWTTQTIKGNADNITALNGRVSYTVTVTGTNTLSGTIPQVTTVLNNAFVKIVATANNTGSVTLNINAEGALPVTKIRTTSGTAVFAPLDANDIRNGNQYLLTKSPDGVRWISLTHSEYFARNLFYDNGDTTYTNLQTKLTSMSTDIDKSLFTDGTRDMTESLTFNKGVSGIVSYKDVLHYKNTGTTNGIMKITMPKSWSNSMITGKMKLFDYNSVGECEIDFGGYNNTTSFWLKPTVHFNGAVPSNSIRFGHDGTNCCILVGLTTSVWNNVHVDITDLVVSYNNVDGWGTGWSLSFIADTTGITNLVEAVFRPTVYTVTSGFSVGWSGTLKYFVSQEGLVGVIIDSLEKTTDIATGGSELVYTIPAGFRPTNDMRVQAFGYTSANAKVNGSSLDVLVGSNGALFIGNNGTVSLNVRKALDIQLIGL